MRIHMAIYTCAFDVCTFIYTYVQTTDVHTDIYIHIHST